MPTATLIVIAALELVTPAALLFVAVSHRNRKD